MKHHCPRVRRLRRVVLGVFLLPPLLWAAVLAIVPTDCARQKIADRLGAATGRSVKLGKIRVGMLGGVHLGDLEIGAPRSGEDPWLTVKDSTLDVSLMQLVLGTIEPTEVEVVEARLRILRRADGSLELSDLIETIPAPSGRSETTPRAHSGLHVRVRNSTVLVVDEPSGTRLEFAEVEGQGSIRERLVSVTELRGFVNGGGVRFAAQLDRGGTALLFEGQIRARDVSLGEGTMALEYLVPVLAGADSSLGGKLSLDLYLRGRGDARAMLRESLVGHGSATLDPIQLEGSKFLTEIGSLVELPDDRRVGSVRSDVTIKGGRITTENLMIEVGKLPIALSGWTDFDGRVDYRLRPDRLADRLPERAKELLTDLTNEVDELNGVTFRGTLDAPVVSLDGAASSGAGVDASQRPEERPKLRRLGRRLRDRIRR